MEKRSSVFLFIFIIFFISHYISAFFATLSADFGFARSFQSPPLQISFDKVRVTPWYQPPEQALGSEMYTPSLDMWAMGCIFAEMLTASPLFQTKDDKGEKLLDVIIQAMGDIEHQWDGIKQLKEWQELKSVASEQYKQQLLALQQHTSTLSAGNGAQNQEQQTLTEEQLKQKFLSQFGIGVKYSLLDKLDKLADRRGRRRMYPVEKDLVQRLVVVNPEMRITAEQALKHPYFTIPPKDHPKLTFQDIETMMADVTLSFVQESSLPASSSSQMVDSLYLLRKSSSDESVSNHSNTEHLNDQAFLLNNASDHTDSQVSPISPQSNKTVETPSPPQPSESIAPNIPLINIESTILHYQMEQYSRHIHLSDDDLLMIEQINEFEQSQSKTNRQHKTTTSHEYADA